MKNEDSFKKLSSEDLKAISDFYNEAINSPIVDEDFMKLKNALHNKEVEASD